MNDDRDEGLRLPLDRGSESELATLRLIGALVVIPASLWGMSLGPALVGWILALAGLGVGIFWIASFVGARRRLSRSEEHYLELGQESLMLVAPEGRRELPWGEVREIEVDEDKLRVTLTLAEGELHLEPRYGGLGVYALAERVRAWQGARRGARQETEQARGEA